MKFKIGDFYINKKSNIIVQITEISGPEVYLKVIEDLNNDSYYNREGAGGVFHGYRQADEYEDYKGYNTPLWKVLNGAL